MARLDLGPIRIPAKGGPLGNYVLREVISPPACLIPASDCGLSKLLDVIISLDAEWREYPLPRYPFRGNRLLSYQGSVLHQRKPGEWRYGEFIHLAGQRLSLARYIGLALEAMGLGYKQAQRTRILLTAHNNLADLAHFTDKESFSPRLQEVQKCMVTLRGPMSFKVEFAHRHYSDISLHLRDTKLLAPDTGKTLEALAEYTQHKKLDIGDWITKMDEFLIQDRDGFEAYAINDCRVALEYLLNICAQAPESIPITVGGLSVSKYVNELGGLKSWKFDCYFGKEYQDIQTKKGTRTIKGNTKLRAIYEKIASECYHGGLNMVMYVGETACGPDQVVLDVDFRGAYSAALGAIPVIDWWRKPKDVDHIETLQDLYQPARIQRMGFIPNILGLVQFDFPRSVNQPCIPVRYENGLFYPLQGETFCTGLEMALAAQLGARVTLIDVKNFSYIKHGDDNSPVLAFADYIGMLNAERARHKAVKMLDTYYKLMANSFYGKLAQGIQDRTKLNFFDELDGTIKKNRLPASAITVPHYAASCTGIIRSALCSIVAGLSACPGFKVLSATTDGCMIVAPRRFDIGDLPVKEDGKIETKGLRVRQLYPEISALEEFPAIKALVVGRRNMHLDHASEWIEIKHVGDTALTLKTRMYEMAYKGTSQHKAHTGFRLDEGETLADLHNRDGIPITAGFRFPNPREIFTDGLDYVQIPERKRINTDYDYKRKWLSSGETVPFLDVAEFKAYRKSVTELRREKRTPSGEIVKEAERAIPEKVAIVAAGMRMHKDEALDDVYRRYIHQAVASGVDEWKVYAGPIKIAEMLGINYHRVFKNYRRKGFIFQRFDRSEALERIAQEVALKLGKRLTPQMLAVLAR